MNDKPTQPQLNIIYKWLSWKIPTYAAKAAVEFVKENKTKKETIAEISRLHDMWESKKLNHINWNASEFWEGFEYEAPKEYGTPIETYENMGLSFTERIRRIREDHEKREKEKEAHERG